VKNGKKLVECDLVNVKNGKRFKRFLTKKQAENLPIHICLPYEYEDRKKLLKGVEDEKNE